MSTDAFIANAATLLLRGDETAVCILTGLGFKVMDAVNRLTADVEIPLIEAPSHRSKCEPRASRTSPLLHALSITYVDTTGLELTAGSVLDPGRRASVGG